MQKCSILIVLMIAALLCGCAGTKKQGVAVNDPLDAVKIEQMTGNHISGAVFERTILCINARRETRWITAVTNQFLAALTNVTLSYVTNQTISLTTNQQLTLATNFAAAPVTPASETNAEAAAALVVASPGPSTNVAVSTASNVSLSKAPSQTTTTASFQTQTSRQFTATANNVSITTADNQLITAETNVIVTVFTNVSVTSVTNLMVAVTNAPVHEHFLVLEFTPPPDFALAAGESLVLLVDGTRHSLAPGTTQTVLVARKGFSAVAYKATPQLLVDLANAKQVKIRVKGASQVIEREMNQASRTNLKKFLVKFFAPADAAPKAASASATDAATPKDS